MAYQYLDHPSDIAVRADGATMEEAFTYCAEAMLGVIFELSTIGKSENIDLEVNARSPELLLVEFLNEILSLQDINSMAVRSIDDAHLEKTPSALSFRCRLRGEPFNKNKHTVKTEVKGATYSALSYKEEDGLHIFQFVIDV